MWFVTYGSTEEIKEHLNKWRDTLCLWIGGPIMKALYQLVYKSDTIHTKITATSLIYKDWDYSKIHTE